MRVGLVCPYDLGRPGGVQAQVFGLGAELHRRGHHVAVLGPGRPQDALGDDAATLLDGHVSSAGPSSPLPGNGSVARLAMGPSVSGRVQRWLAREQPDIVHVHEPALPGLGIAAVRRARASGLPVVATFHASRPVSRGTARAGGPLVRRMLGPVTVATAVSQQAWTVASRLLQLNAIVVPNALDVSSFEDFDDKSALPAGVAEGPPTVLFVGRRDEPRKGLPVLAAALPTLRALVPDVQVVVAGPGRTRVEGAIDLGGVSEPAKRALLHTADVLVAPHTGRESFGIVLAEAMAAGTPVVASDLPAFRDVLGEAGVLVPTGDHEALARALASVLTDPRVAEQMRERGRSRVRRWDWQTVGSRWEGLYERAFGAFAQGS